VRAAWELKKLGEVSDFQGGSQPPKSQFAYEEKPGFVRFLQIRDFGEGEKVTFIPESNKNRICTADDLLIGRYGASVGKILSGKAGAYNVALIKSVPDDSIVERSWFYYYLISSEFQERLLGAAARSAQAGFSKEDIHDFPVPIPPRLEQQRISAILDKAFAAIATAKANTQKNLIAARGTFESFLNAASGAAGKNWSEKTIAEIAVHSLGKMLDKNKNKGVPLPYLRNLNVRWFDFDLSDVLEMRFLPEEEAKYTARSGDVLVCEGGYPGRAAIWDREEPIHFQKALHRVRFHEPNLNKWFVYFLYAKDLSGELRSNFTGAGILHFTGEALAKFRLPIPPRSELLGLVTRFDELRIAIEALERTYSKKTALLQNLQTSLLSQAFAGAL
jgi:type I restriction enzyme S subunit